MISTGHSPSMLWDPGPTGAGGQEDTLTADNLSHNKGGGGGGHAELRLLHSPG